MNKAGLAVVVIIVAAIIVGAGFYVLVLSSNGRGVGFDPTDLKAPTIAYAQAVDNSLPTPLTTSSYSYENVNLYWSITEDIFAGYGGALDLTVENKNPGKMYVYAFGLQWVSSGTVYLRNCSVLIDHGQMADLGMLIFGAPSSGNREYKLMLYFAVSNLLGTAWKDVGALPSSTSSAIVKSLGYTVDVEADLNSWASYNKINERVSYSNAQSVASYIKAKYPGSYSILHIAEAFAWMKANVEYEADPVGDYWQTAQETMSLRTGDCEDHAILMASIIGALGGSARVNLIEEHAFPTVFVASDYAGLMKVKQSLASYYGVDNATYKMAYLVDENGYWLVVDTTGFPYAGGLPAKSEPTSASGDWTVLSSYLHSIDATGATASSGVFGLF